MSEIVRPSPEAAELVNVSAPLAATATRVRVDPSGDVVMTAVDQAQDEDANLRKIVAPLHVNLGISMQRCFGQGHQTVWRI